MQTADSLMLIFFFCSVSSPAHTQPSCCALLMQTARIADVKFWVIPVSQFGLAWAIKLLFSPSRAAVYASLWYVLGALWSWHPSAGPAAHSFSSSANCEFAHSECLQQRLLIHCKLKGKTGNYSLSSSSEYCQLLAANRC